MIPRESATAAASTSHQAAMAEARERTLALVSPLSEADLARVVDPLLSPLLWDLGHIANFEQRWLLGSDDRALDTVYDPFAQPRAKRGELPFLHSDECFDYMAAVRDRVNLDFDRHDPFLVELVIQHEMQHNETMLQLLRMLDGYEPPRELRAAPQDAINTAMPGWVEFPGGDYVIGSTRPGDGEFVYDNERDAHRVSLDAFSIAKLPVTNGEYAAWIADGGYDRREWWSPAGREWLNANGSAMPMGWRRDGGMYLEDGFGGPRPLDLQAPVCHVSWFEADAYARAHGARLPSEFEWEAAASYDPALGADGPRRRHGWGDGSWEPGAANLDHGAFGTVTAGLLGAAAAGPADMNGQVWEWTASEFSPYPGFSPFAYSEYSAPFFDSAYRVLRGGSWATRARTVDNRFRNWDHPQRRQIFAGFRLAKEVA